MNILGIIVITVASIACSAVLFDLLVSMMVARVAEAVVEATPRPLHDSGDQRTDGDSSNFHDGGNI